MSVDLEDSIIDFPLGGRVRTRMWAWTHLDFWWKLVEKFRELILEQCDLWMRCCWCLEVNLDWHQPSWHPWTKWRGARPKSRFTGDSQTLCAQAKNHVLKAQNMGKSSPNSVWTEPCDWGLCSTKFSVVPMPWKACFLSCCSRFGWKGDAWENI